MKNVTQVRLMTKTNILQLSAQLATFGAIDTMAAQSLWAIALREMSAEQCRALIEALPKTGAVAGVCRNGLLSLALERHTVPMGLGGK